MIDLITQLIENLNVAFRTMVKVDKLLNKDWDNVGINKNEKKVLQKGIESYVKAAEAKSKRRANYLNQIECT